MMKGSGGKKKKLYLFTILHLSEAFFLSLSLSPVITQHTSHFNTGLSALSERSNLALVMKTYIPAPLPERRPH